MKYIRSKALLVIILSMVIALLAKYNLSYEVYADNPNQKSTTSIYVKSEHKVGPYEPHKHGGGTVQ